MKKTPKIEEIPDYKVVQIGDWIFEVSSVRALKVGKDGVYGDPYEAIANFNFIDGKAYVNGMLGSGITKRCIVTFKKYIASYGIKEAVYKRVKNLKSKFKKVKLDKGT